MKTNININIEDKEDMGIVVKTNRLNMAIQNLSLAEIRLIQLAIVDARESEKGIDTVTALAIHASRYADAFNVSRHAAYDALINAESNLFKRYFTFLDKVDGLPVKSSWISQAKYKKSEGVIEIMFTPAVVNEITRIDGIEQFFTQYALEQIAEMTSIYSIRLYELLNQWKTAKKTPIFYLEIFRQQLGICVNEYKRMSDFKRRVLDLAVKEINEKSNLKVSYEQEKKGAVIIGFKFKVFEKTVAKDKEARTIRDVDTLDTFKSVTEKSDKAFKPMTIGQISFFASLLAKDSSFNSSENGLIANIGESDKDYQMRVQRSLNDYKNQVKWLDYLLKHDFKTE